MPRPMAPLPPSGRPGPFGGLMQDIRYAVRMLRRAPGFSAAAILTLALGMSMSTAILAVVNSVLLRPIPFADADRLVMVWETDRDSGTTYEPASLPDFVDFRERTRQLSHLTLLAATELTCTPDEGEPIRLPAVTAGAAFMETLGVQPVAGRGFTHDETRPGGPAVILISERLWAGGFGSGIGCAWRLPSGCLWYLATTRDRLSGALRRRKLLE